MVPPCLLTKIGRLPNLVVKQQHRDDRARPASNELQQMEGSLWSSAPPLPSGVLVTSVRDQRHDAGEDHPSEKPYRPRRGVCVQHHH
jgi:hypothetical protein